MTRIARPRSYKDDVCSRQTSEVKLQLGGISRLPLEPTPWLWPFVLFLLTISQKSFCPTQASVKGLLFKGGLLTAIPYCDGTTKRRHLGLDTAGVQPMSDRFAYVCCGFVLA